MWLVQTLQKVKVKSVARGKVDSINRPRQGKIIFVFHVDPEIVGTLATIDHVKTS
jgi:hypothetical protein